MKVKGVFTDGNICRQKSINCRPIHSWYLMTKEEKIERFDPNGVGLKNGKFIGLPFDEENASIVLLPVPWDATVSFSEGTSTGASNILECSSQLDLADKDLSNAWKTGLYMRPPDPGILESNRQIRELAKPYIEFLEAGSPDELHEAMRMNLEAVNESCQNLRNWVYQQSKSLLGQGKIVGLVGGDHSVPLGYLEALAERYKNFGILHIDAHMDLREAYEGFRLSHASIMYNVLAIAPVNILVQVGIRDYCEEEFSRAKSSEKVKVFFDQDMKDDLFKGKTWEKICSKIVKSLPDKVYISFDIDGLDPKLCPNTGTPVPGGLSFDQAVFLLKTVAKSGKKIIGFDLVEVGGIGNEWDGNVGARLLYKLANWTAYSQKLIG